MTLLRNMIQLKSTYHIYTWHPCLYENDSFPWQRTGIQLVEKLNKVSPALCDTSPWHDGNQLCNPLNFCVPKIQLHPFIFFKLRT